MKDNSKIQDRQLDKLLNDGLSYKSPDLNIDIDSIERKRNWIYKMKYLPLLTLGLANIYGLFLPNGINSFSINEDMSLIFSNSSLLTFSIGLFLIYCYVIYINKTVQR